MRGLTLFGVVFLTCSVFAQKNTTLRLEDYLSKYKQKEFELDYQKNITESLKLRDSWIAPLQLNYRYNKSNPYDNTQTSKNASISINQPVFRSGGIYYGIQFAEENKRYTNYKIDSQKRKLVKEAIGLLMQIKQTDLQLQKQKKQVENSKIKLEQKKEEYLSGNLDSGFLDNAIIELNLVKQKLFEIETNKEKLISKFSALSDMDYESAYIPYLKNIQKDIFIQHNIVLNMYKSESQKNLYAKNVTVAKYLPSFNITGSYNRDELNNPSFAGTPVPAQPPTTYYNYGFSISMPLDFNTFRDIQSAKIDYLKSNVMIEDKKRELTSLYEQVEQNLKKIDNKIVLAQENYEIYQKIFADTQKLYTAGYKTKSDVDLLQNSMDMALIDVEIYKLEKQLELLNLYEYYIVGESVAVQ
jgi:outer membrane protein TolC